MCPQTAVVKKRQEPAVALMLSIAVLGVEPGNIHVGTQPRSQGFFLRKWEGREKAMASAGHMTQKTPRNCGSIKLA